jgi:hypothetical protein
LCRAQGIPAWADYGLLYDPGANELGLHSWLNVVIPVKTNNGMNNEICCIDVVNDEFLLRDPYRITEWTDTGTTMDYYGDEIYNLEYYMNYFSTVKSPIVSISISEDTDIIDVEEAGSRKIYKEDQDFTVFYIYILVIFIMTIAWIVVYSILHFVGRNEVTVIENKPNFKMVIEEERDDDWDSVSGGQMWNDQ